MEWTDNDGAWDEGDDAYPPAPVPAHERTWRHPSELGQAAWVMSETPVALGRGLMVTTGAIGCVLGIAILWLMIPSRGGFAPSAASSSAGLRSVSSTAIEAPATTVAVIDEVTETTMSLAALFGGATLPAEDMPTNTMHLDSGTGDAVAIAVSIGDSPYLVTTAHAVSGQTEVSMQLESGNRALTPVIEVDAALAYLQPGDGFDATGFARAAAASPGDTVTVLATQPTTMAFGDASALAQLAAEGILEGTPVVDEHGAIVALCTMRSGSVEMVPIGKAPDPTPSSATDSLDGSTPDP